MFAAALQIGCLPPRAREEGSLQERGLQERGLVQVMPYYSVAKGEDVDPAHVAALNKNPRNDMNIVKDYLELCANLGIEPPESVLHALLPAIAKPLEKLHVGGQALHVAWRCVYRFSEVHGMTWHGMCLARLHGHRLLLQPACSCTSACGSLALRP